MIQIIHSDSLVGRIVCERFDETFELFEGKDGEYGDGEYGGGEWIVHHVRVCMFNSYDRVCKTRTCPVLESFQYGAPTATVFPSDDRDTAQPEFS